MGKHAVSGSGLHEGLNPSEPSPNIPSTTRGFPGPTSALEAGRQEQERLYIVRLTKHERELLRADRSGVAGRFCLLPATADGTYELVRYADA